MFVYGIVLKDLKGFSIFFHHLRDERRFFVITISTSIVLQMYFWKSFEFSTEQFIKNEWPNPCWTPTFLLFFNPKNHIKHNFLKKKMYIYKLNKTTYFFCANNKFKRNMKWWFHLQITNGINYLNQKIYFNFFGFLLLLLLLYAVSNEHILHWLVKKCIVVFNFM